jgi:hypothetical protein
MDRAEMFEQTVAAVGVAVGVYGEDGRYTSTTRTPTCWTPTARP